MLSDGRVLHGFRWVGTGGATRDASCGGGALGCNGRWAQNPFSKVEGLKPKTRHKKDTKHFILHGNCSQVIILCVYRRPRYISVVNMKILISAASTID